MPKVNAGPSNRLLVMTWAQWLKRVFSIDIETCEKCGGPVRIIASIEDFDVIQKILKYLGLDQVGDPQNPSPPLDLTDKRHYFEFQPVDYGWVTVSNDRDSDSMDKTPNF